MSVSANMETTAVFAWNYNSQARININQGGTSSGKTYAILQVIFMKLIQDTLIATVVGQDIPNLKAGAIRDFQERILPACPWMNNFIASYNKTERKYRFKNGSILEFKSFKDKQDAQSGKRHISFFNEANGIPWAIYEQVAMRTTETIFLDYNPSAEFWAHDRVMTDPKSVTFYSNFSHNPYVEPDIIDYLRSLKTKDPESWRVYGLGKTGSISELVFERATIVDEMPRGLRYEGYGLDFGYRADPTTLIHCGLANGRDIYLDEVFYGHRMKTSDIDKTMTDKEVFRHMGIYADSSEHRVIDDLYALNWKIVGADKGPGSIEYGIDLLNDYNLHITSASHNIINERKRYRHKIDSKTGKLLNEPIDAYNHTWDAIRYWAVMNLKPIRKRKSLRFRN